MSPIPLHIQVSLGGNLCSDWAEWSASGWTGNDETIDLYHVNHQDDIHKPPRSKLTAAHLSNYLSDEYFVQSITFRWKRWWIDLYHGKNLTAGDLDTKLYMYKVIWSLNFKLCSFSQFDLKLGLKPDAREQKYHWRCPEQPNPFNIFCLCLLWPTPPCAI